MEGNRKLKKSRILEGEKCSNESEQEKVGWKKKTLNEAIEASAILDTTHLVSGAKSRSRGNGRGLFCRTRK